MSNNFGCFSTLILMVLFLMILVACSYTGSNDFEMGAETSQISEQTLLPEGQNPTIYNGTNEINYTATVPSLPISEPTYEPTPTPAPEQELSFVDYWLEQLTLEEKIGQLFMIRLPWQSTSVDARIRRTLEVIPVGGIILFRDNVTSTSQVQTLISDLQNLSPRLPLFMSVDEEGGRVSRLGHIFPDGPTPSALEIGQSGDIARAYEVGQTLAERLLSLGFNMNFAPVADVWSNPTNTVIGNRAFGHTAEEVIPFVSATVEGMQNNGVFAVLKHFPGHGDTNEDSHFELAFQNFGRERFDELESRPFIAGVESNVSGVMMAHISTPEFRHLQNPPLFDFLVPWHENGNLPATFSSYWIRDILRGEMGFDGLVITDALDMRAISDNFDDGQSALAAFLAGADILLMPVNVENAFNAMVEAYHAGVFDRERLNESVRRILTAKEVII